MTYYVLRPYGNEGPNGKRSYVKRTNTAFKSKADATKWAKTHVISGVKAIYATKSSLQSTYKKSGPHVLYYKV